MWQYNIFGYCKYGNKCFRKHEDKVFENQNCEVQSKTFRHPRRCRFFLEYNYCKFGTFCRFRHKKLADEASDKEIEILKKALEILKIEIAEKIESINNKETQIKELEEKNQIVRAENQELRQKVEQLQSDLEVSRNTVAVNNMLHDDFKERVGEKYGYNSNDSESDYEPDEEIRTKNRIIFRLKKVEELKKMAKCDVCDYTTKSEVGLKSHKTKKHK